MRNNKPVDEEIERKPSISCGRKDCRENLFGYCQILPDLDDEGKCKIYKIRGEKYEVGNLSR